MALCNEVKPLHIVPIHLVHPLKPNSPTHLAMSQVELVERLLKNLGTENSGFTVDNIMRVGIRIYSVLSIPFSSACLTLLECLVQLTRT